MYWHHRRNFPEEKIKIKIPDLISKKVQQNKYIWMKAALGMMTTDTHQMAMEECLIVTVELKYLVLQSQHDPT